MKDGVGRCDCQEDQMLGECVNGFVGKKHTRAPSRCVALWMWTVMSWPLLRSVVMMLPRY
jgi:hypothetical protein